MTDLNSLLPANSGWLHNGAFAISNSGLDGLELDNVFLGSRYMPVKMSIPYFHIPRVTVN